jgi:salicylate hydroxylase
VLRHDPRAITLNRRATAVAEAADGVQVTLDDGRVLVAELLVGADGIKSVVRRQVLGDDRPQFTGQVAWRCLVPTERIPPALRTDLVSTIWCGPRNHAVTYYLRAGSLLNFVGCVERPW